MSKAQQTKAAFRHALIDSGGAVPCRQTEDTDAWFAQPGSSRAQWAKAQCRLGCPLIDKCGLYAIENGIPFGIWGGIDEFQREHLWKKRGGKPTAFLDEMDAAIGPALQERRDFENFDSTHNNPYEEEEVA